MIKTLTAQTNESSEQTGNASSVWTRFMDMHSGGATKEKPYEYIYIQAPEPEARIIFYNRFGHNPNRVTCTCCGEDYSVSEEATLLEATAYDRGCTFVYLDRDGNEVPRNEAWIPGKGTAEGVKGCYVERGDPERSWINYLSLSDYLAQSKNVLVIRADEVQDSERVGEIPEQGYVWQG